MVYFRVNATEGAFLLRKRINDGEKKIKNKKGGKGREKKAA